MTTENLSNGDDVSLKDFIIKLINSYKYLLSKWILIGVVGLIGSILGFVYASFKQPTYTAITTFVLEDGGGGGLNNLGGLASMVGLDIGSRGGIFQGDNILELYKSRSMIEKALLSEVDNKGNKSLLIEEYIKFNKLRESWVKKPELAQLQFRRNDQSQVLHFTRLQDSIIGIIINDISKNYLNVSKPDKKLSIIKAEVKARDEFFAKTFNDQIVKNVNDFYIQTKTKRSLENVAILQRKTDSVSAVMNGAIYIAAAVADATPNLNPTKQVQRTSPVQRAQFSAETNKAMLIELVKNLEMSRISLLKETPLVQVIDRPVFPLGRDQVSKVKGVLLGGILAGILAVIFLSLRRLLAVILK